MRLNIHSVLCFVALFMVTIPALPFSVQPHTNPTFVKIIVPFKTDLVWQWTLRALSKYKVEMSDVASKNIQTQWIKDPFNTHLFSVYNYFPYHQELKTRLRLRLIEEQPNVSVVNIFKDFIVFKDILRGWANIEPDGIEEYVVGYRIRQLAYYHYIIAGKEKKEE